MTNSAHPSWKSPRVIVAISLMLLAGTAGWFFAAQAITRTSPSLRALHAGDLSEVLEHVRSKDETGLAIGEDALTAANAARQLRAREQHDAWLARAVELGAPMARVELEKTLWTVANSPSTSSPRRQIRSLVDQGASSEDAFQAVVLGMLDGGMSREVEPIVAQWEADLGTGLRLQVAKARLLLSQQQVDTATELLQECIRSYPEAELAYVQLASCYESKDAPEIERALLVQAFIREHFPSRETGVATDIATTLRRTGKPDLALDVLQNSEPANTRLERAQALFDMGDYQASWETLSELGSQPDDIRELVNLVFRVTMGGAPEDGDEAMERTTLSAMTSAMLGQRANANTFFALALDRIGRLRRYIDLVAKLPLYPGDQGLAQAVAAIQNLELAQQKLGPQPLAAPDPVAEQMPGYATYREHCLHCHGANGNGQGRTGRHLFPGPRNFRTDRMRFVSGANGMATDEDLAHTIRRGLKGVSMPAFDQLTESELDDLVNLLRYFQRAGLAEAYAEQLADTPGAASDDGSQRSEWIQQRLVASSPLEIPDWLLREDAGSVEQPRQPEVWTSTGCVRCHLDKAQPSPMALHDSAGQPILAPRLGRDMAKSCFGPVDVYKRIRVGIPGTPHPTFDGTPEETRELTEYVWSLVKDATVTGTTNSQRRQLLLSPTN